MMSYILVIWTVVATMSGGTNANTVQVKDWRPIGEFKNAEACKFAAAILQKDGNSAICLPTDTRK